MGGASCRCRERLGVCIVKRRVENLMRVAKEVVSLFKLHAAVVAFLLTLAEISGAPTLSATGLSQTIDSSTTLEQIISWSNAASNAVTIHINSTSSSEANNTLHVLSSLVISNPYRTTIIGHPVMYASYVSLLNTSSKMVYYDYIQVGAYPKVVFDDGSVPFFDVSSYRKLSLAGLTLTATAQACIAVSEGEVAVSNCTFTDNTGCVVNAHHSLVTISDTVVANNTNPSGSIMVFRANTSATLERNAMTFNSAATHGGVISASNSAVDLIECALEANRVVSSYGSGGAISVNSSRLNIVDSLVAYNLAAYGGGICAKYGSTVTVAGSAFERNIASILGDYNYSETNSGGGGAISLLTHSSLQIEKSSFLQNRVGPGSSGGAIRAESASVGVKQSAFGGNVAYPPGKGGAVFCTDCTFTVEGQNQFAAKTHDDVPKKKKAAPVEDAMDKIEKDTKESKVPSSTMYQAEGPTYATMKAGDAKGPWTKARPMKNGDVLDKPNRFPGEQPAPDVGAHGVPEKYYTNEWQANYTATAPTTRLGVFLARVTNDFRYDILRDMVHDVLEYYEVAWKQNKQPFLPMGDGALLYLMNATYTSPSFQCSECDFSK